MKVATGVERGLLHSPFLLPCEQPLTGYRPSALVGEEIGHEQRQHRFDGCKTRHVSFREDSLTILDCGGTFVDEIPARGLVAGYC